MINRLVLTRILSLLINILTFIVLLSACGGAYPATEVSATEIPSDASTSSVPPVATQTQQPIIIPVTGGDPPAPAIPETRRLTLEYPPKMKAGVEGDIVRLTLEVDDLGNITPTAQIGGNTVAGEVIEIPNLYESHFVTAEAHIDMAGMEIQPAGSIYEPLKPGQSATFHWSVRPQETGVYRGTVWLHLEFEDRISGERGRMALSGQIIEIEAVDFFGFSVNVVRTSGLVGSILSLVVGLPFFDDIVKFLFRKKRRTRK